MTNPYFNRNSTSYTPAQSGQQPLAIQHQRQPREESQDLFPNTALSQQWYSAPQYNFNGSSPWGDGNHSYPSDGGYYPKTGVNTGYGGYHPTVGAGDTGGGHTDPARYQVDTALVEVGVYNDGTTDDHAKAVKEVYQRHNPLGRNNVYFTGVGNEKPASSSDTSGGAAHLANKKELDEHIDREATDALDIMSDKITEITQQGEIEVINGSLGYTRNTIYENTLMSLVENPKLAPAMGLQVQDITSLEKNEDDQVLVTEKVSNAIIRYVDNRMDQPGSAHQKSKAKYQEATRSAAENGVTVVMAAGNDHELNEVFSGRNQGGDTNLLTQSDYIINVAATDDKNTTSLHDDEIASFSSWGDGRYNPTLSADGVEVPTRQGKQDGTSFATPQVAATVARMRQINPNLTFDQIKAILQQSSTDLYPNSTIADGAGIMNPELAVQWSQQMSQTA